MSLPALELKSPLSAAYDHCEALTRRASSNFYWGFRLLPHDRRRALCAVYAFCRAADDIADEPGAARDPERLLARWRAELEAVYAGRPRHPIGVALADTAERFAIPREHFEAVIAGVEMDLRRNRYETWEDELAEYCYRVAGAVGLVCIEVFGYRDRERQARSDDICTALQLTNFWQDVAADLTRGRVYIPQEDLDRFPASRAALEARVVNDDFRRLLAFEVARTRDLFVRGLALAGMVTGRLAREVRVFARGGLAILDRIVAADYDVFARRPTLTRGDLARLVLRGLLG